MRTDYAPASRRHVLHEGRADGRVTVPRADWGMVRPPSEEAIEATGRIAQAQIGERFYRRIASVQTACQIANTRLSQIRSQSHVAAQREDAARRTLDELLARVSEEQR